MHYGLNPLLAALLAILAALAVALPARPAVAAGGFDAPLCEGCCATAPAQSGCASASACAPASADTGAEETAMKPVGVWAVGVLRPAVPRAVTCRTWTSVPASASLGPPAYLSFGHFLL